MNRRRFLFALAALPIAATVGKLLPTPLTPSMKYNTYLLGKDAVFAPVTPREIGQLVSYRYTYSAKVMDDFAPRYVRVENVAQPV